MSGSIVGVWTLRSFHMEGVGTQERSEPFGPHPRGTLILHPDGRMAALVTPGEGGTPPLPGGPPAQFQQLIAYSGRYRLEPPDHLVTSVDVACFPHWVGTDQARRYRLDGDRLDILTPPGTMPRPDGSAVSVVATLSFTRESSRPA